MSRYFIEYGHYNFLTHHASYLVAEVDQYLYMTINGQWKKSSKKFTKPTKSYYRTYSLLSDFDGNKIDSGQALLSPYLVRNFWIEEDDYV